LCVLHFTGPPPDGSPNFATRWQPSCSHIRTPGRPRPPLARPDAAGAALAGSICSVGTATGIGSSTATPNSVRAAPGFCCKRHGSGSVVWLAQDREPWVADKAEDGARLQGAPARAHGGDVPPCSEMREASANIAPREGGCLARPRATSPAPAAVMCAAARAQKPPRRPTSAATPSRPLACRQCWSRVCPACGQPIGLPVVHS